MTTKSSSSMLMLVHIDGSCIGRGCWKQYANRFIGDTTHGHYWLGNANPDELAFQCLWDSSDAHFSCHGQLFDDGTYQTGWYKKTNLNNAYHIGWQEQLAWRFYAFYTLYHFGHLLLLLSRCSCSRTWILIPYNYLDTVYIHNLFITSPPKHRSLFPILFIVI